MLVHGTNKGYEVVCSDRRKIDFVSCGMCGE